MSGSSMGFPFHAREVPSLLAQFLSRAFQSVMGEPFLFQPTAS